MANGDSHKKNVLIMDKHLADMYKVVLRDGKRDFSTFVEKVEAATDTRFDKVLYFVTPKDDIARQVKRYMPRVTLIECHNNCARLLFMNIRGYMRAGFKIVIITGLCTLVTAMKRLTMKPESYPGTIHVIHGGLYKTEFLDFLLGHINPRRLMRELPLIQEEAAPQDTERAASRLQYTNTVVPNGGRSGYMPVARQPHMVIPHGYFPVTVNPYMPPPPYYMNPYSVMYQNALYRHGMMMPYAPPPQQYPIMYYEYPEYQMQQYPSPHYAEPHIGYTNAPPTSPLVVEEKETA